MAKRTYGIPTVAVGSKPYVIAKLKLITKRVVEIRLGYDVAFYFVFIGFVNHKIFRTNPVSEPVY